MSANVVPLSGLAGVPDVAGDHLNAQLFLDQHGENVRRAPELGRWFVWTGAWWEEDRLDRVPEMATDTIDRLRAWVAEADGHDEHKRRSQHYQASTKAGRRDALLSVAGTDPNIVVAVNQLDAHPTLLACANGTVDLTTGELRPAARVHLLTRGVAIEYDPDARSVLWEQTLTTIFDGDAELIAYVQRLFGYCLTGVVHEHLAPVLWGSGANGKSTLIKIVQELMGEHAITAPEGLVIQRRHEPHPERLAVLRGRRLVVSNELEEDAVLNEAMVKTLTGGDTISARELYGRRFNFAPTHKVVLVTNHRPRVHGVDHAIWRRLCVVPFSVTIPSERQDPTLGRRLLDDEHGPAVFAWLVRGAVSWHREGIGEAAAVANATHEYRRSQDVLGAWLEEHTEPTVGAVTKVGELFDAWRTWCAGSGEAPGRRQDFASGLEARGITTEMRGHNRLARGIALRVSTREHSSRNSLNSLSRGTLGTSPHESSSAQVRAPEPTDDDLARMFLGAGE
jgi:putative DNA primase/helicase